jgi:hypothetical protein
MRMMLRALGFVAGALLLVSVVKYGAPDPKMDGGMAAALLATD